MSTPIKKKGEEDENILLFSWFGKHRSTCVYNYKRRGVFMDFFSPPTSSSEKGDEKWKKYTRKRIKPSPSLIRHRSFARVFLLKRREGAEPFIITGLVPLLSFLFISRKVELSISRAEARVAADCWSQREKQIVFLSLLFDQTIAPLYFLHKKKTSSYY